VEVVGAVVVDVVVLVDVEVEGATVVVVTASLVVVSSTDEEVDEVLSALLCSSEHAPRVNASAPRVRTARARREVMASVCQPERAMNVQVSG
jgi:hypothetical protein